MSDQPSQLAVGMQLLKEASDVAEAFRDSVALDRAAEEIIKARTAATLKLDAAMQQLAKVRRAMNVRSGDLLVRVLYTHSVGWHCEVEVLLDAGTLPPAPEIDTGETRGVVLRAIQMAKQ